MCVYVCVCSEGGLSTWVCGWYRIRGSFMSSSVVEYVGIVVNLWTGDVEYLCMCVCVCLGRCI